MANRKITQFPAFNGVDIQENDLLTLVHIFEVDPSLRNKKITFAEFKAYLNQFYATFPTVTGEVTIDGNLTVTGSITGEDGQFNNLDIVDGNDVLVASISGDNNGAATFASGNFTVNPVGSVATSGTLDVNGILTISSGLTANGSAGTAGYFLKSNGPGQPVVWDEVDNTDISFSGITVSGDAYFQSGIFVTGDSTISGLLTVSGLTVTGDLTTSGNGQFNNINVVDDNDILVAYISGDDSGAASFASGNFTIANDGDTTTSGTLGVSGIVTIASGLNANGAEGISGYILTSNGPGQPVAWEAAPGIGGDGVFDTLLVRSGITSSGDLITSGLTVTGSTAYFQSGISVTGDSSVSGLLTVSGLTVTGDLTTSGNGQFNNLRIIDDNDVLVARVSGDNSGSAMFASGNFAIEDDGDTTISGDTSVSGLITASGITATGTISGEVFVVTVAQGSVGLFMGSGTISGTANGPLDTNQNSVIVRGPLVILPSG